MSRIGKQAVSIPEKVEVKIVGSAVGVKGPNGSLHFDLPKRVSATATKTEVLVVRDGEDREARSLHGLCRSQIANMVHGVSVGFTKELEINGVGYRAEAKGRELHLALGFSHPVIYQLPKGIEAVVDAKRTRVSLSGIDKQKLGNCAAEIRSFRPPEPYKGKGVKYANEVIVRKEGKSAGK